MIRKIFGNTFTDVLSGYRVLSRRFVKSFPCFSKGFEIEVDMAIHALELGMPVKEIESPYKTRQEGSYSKLNTYQDGIRILFKIISLFICKKPCVFFGVIAFILFLISVLLVIPIVHMWLVTGLVPRIPTIVLCSSLVVVSAISLIIGILMEAIYQVRRTSNCLVYLGFE